MLSLTNARLAEVKQRLPLPCEQTESAPSVVPTQDEVAEQAARAALHNILFPGHPMSSHEHGHGHGHGGNLPSNAASQTMQPGWGVPLPAGIAPRQAMICPPVGMVPAPAAPSIHVQPPTANGSHQGEARSDNQATPRATSRSIGPDTDGVAPSTAHTPSPPATASRGVQVPSVPGIRVAKTSPVAAPPPPISPIDPLCPPLPFPRPWDVVTQRLFSWAVVWMQDDFVRALETTALGGQADEFALTIYSMMTFKR